MFYWMKRSGGGAPEGLGGLDNMSKAEILRGIVTEKLTTAAQEILAVVERTVAGYEEEASGFRQEIARQRRQLEVLLQPRVQLERRALIPDLESHDVVVVSEGEEEEEQQQQTQQTGVGDTGSLGLLWFDEDDDDDDDEEEEQPSTQQATSCRQKREALRDPDYQIPSRTFSPRVRSDKKKRGRPRISDAQTHLDLRICVLDDTQSDLPSNLMFRKCPVQELQCPRGLQESDFLDLLRSTFPQLTADKPFDIFTSDRSRRLHPLQVTTLTPEEIDRSIRAAGAGKSALYIRLKTGDEPQTSSDDLRPPQRPDDAEGDSPSSSASVTPNQTDSSTSSFPKDQFEKRRRGRPRLGEEPTHHSLKICMLEDSESDVLSKTVFMKSSVQELRCPRSLQEADFLDLLRSTFPQLAGENKRFNMFKSDRSRRLQRLRVKTITPEEIYRSMKSTRGAKTLVYIRLKTGEEGEEEEEELNLLPANDDAAAAAAHDDGDDDESPSAVAVEMKSDDSGPGSSGSARPSSSTSRHVMDTDDEDVAGSVNEDGDGDQTLDKDDDWKPAAPGRCLPKRALIERRRAGDLETSKTPCKVCGVWYRMRGSLIKHAWSHVDEAQGVCGVCGARFESAEELKRHLRSYRQTHSCSFCGKSFSTVSGLSCHTTLHTGNQPFKCDVCGKAFARKSSLSIHRWVHVADKPHKCAVCPKAFGLKAQLKAHSKVHTGNDRYLCNICGKSVYDLRSLTRHKATHSGERRYGCEVCGKRFKILGTLRSHEKIHTVRERPYLCDICCKTFVSNCGLMAHMRTHSNERPFICIMCSKGFVSNGELKVHMRVHTGEAPYGCSECGRYFKRRTHLNNHVRSHLGIKLFVCGVCGKACSRQEHLTVHMRTHNGERPYKCSLCDKAFTQSHCLKTHMKSHQAQENPFLDPSASGRTDVGPRAEN